LCPGPHRTDQCQSAVTCTCREWSSKSRSEKKPHRPGRGGEQGEGRQKERNAKGDLCSIQTHGDTVTSTKASGQSSNIIRTCDSEQGSKTSDKHVKPPSSQGSRAVPALGPISFRRCTKNKYRHRAMKSRAPRGSRCPWTGDCPCPQGGPEDGEVQSQLESPTRGSHLRRSRSDAMEP